MGSGKSCRLHRLAVLFSGRFSFERRILILRGIRKLQFSNALIGFDKLSILLGFFEANRTGFSNAAVLRCYDCQGTIGERLRDTYSRILQHEYNAMPYRGA